MGVWPGLWCSLGELYSGNASRQRWKSHWALKNEEVWDAGLKCPKKSFQEQKKPHDNQKRGGRMWQLWLWVMLSACKLCYLLALHLDSNRRVDPKCGHVPMPGTCGFVALRGRGELSLQMGLSLLNSRQGIILDYPCSVAQSCLTLCDPMDRRPPGSSVHGIFQAKILEWVAISFSREYCRPRGQTRVSCISCTVKQILYDWAIWEVLRIFQMGPVYSQEYWKVEEAEQGSESESEAWKWKQGQRDPGRLPLMVEEEALSQEMLCCAVLSPQSCPTLFDPKDCSLPGSSVHEILWARILEWVATPFSRGSSQTRDGTQVSHSAGGFFIIWVTSEAPRNASSLWRRRQEKGLSPWAPRKESSPVHTSVFTQ